MTDGPGTGTGSRHRRVRLHRFRGRARPDRSTATRCGHCANRAELTTISPACRSSGSSATSAIPPTLDRAVDGVSTVFHLAAVYRFWAADPDLFYDVNIGGTQNVVRAVERAGCDRLVYTSTVGTIGVAEHGRLASEDTLVHFEHLFGHYKRSKYLAEHEVLRAGAAGRAGGARAPDVPGRRTRHRAHTDRPHDRRVPERSYPRVRRHRAQRRARRRRRPRPCARRADMARSGAATSSAARTCRCRRCSRRSPTSAVSPHRACASRPAPSCRSCAARNGSSRRSCTASRRCRRSRCAWPRRAWSTTRAAPAPSSVTRACPRAQRSCARRAGSSTTASSRPRRSPRSGSRAKTSTSATSPTARVARQ